MHPFCVSGVCVSEVNLWGVSGDNSVCMCVFVAGRAIAQGMYCCFLCVWCVGVCLRCGAWMCSLQRTREKSRKVCLRFSVSSIPALRL